jgi:hypothetical protein
MKIILHIVFSLFIFQIDSLFLMAQIKPNPIQHAAASKNGSNYDDLITLGDGPNAPVAAAATNITTSSFVASWNTVSGATSYQLDVSANNFTTYVTGYFSKELTVTRDTISGLLAGSNYRYRVRAVNTRGMSANSNTIVVSMLKQSQTITFPPLLDKTLGDAVFSLTATASSGLTVTYSTTSDKVTLNQNQVTLKKSGRVLIAANQAGDATYDLAPTVTQSFCIKPTKPTVTVNNTVPNAPVLTSNAATGNQWFYNGAMIAGAVNATYTATSMGGYSVSVMVDDCVNSSNDVSVAVAPVAAAATAMTSSGFNASWGSVTGSTSYLLDVSADNFVTFVSGYNGRELTTTIHIVTGLAPVKAYRYRVRAKNGSLTSANSNVISVTTSKENQTISFTALPERTLGDAPFTLSATASSILAVEFSTTSDKITISGNQVTITKAGRASIVANQAGNTVFNAALAVTQSFCIKPTKPTVTVNNTVPNAPVLTSNAATGNQWFYNGAMIAGAVNTTYTATSMGAYSVSVMVDDCVNSSNDVSVAVAPVAAAATAITSSGFNASWGSVTGSTSYLLDVSADNFATFLSGYNGRELTTTIHIVTGLAPVKAYRYRVRAKNGLLTSANSSVISVTTSKENQTITFAALSERTLGDVPFTLAASASSSLPVTFSTTSDKITISDNQVNITKVGRASVVANQAGNTVFNAAPAVTQSFCIKPAKPNVSYNSTSLTLASNASEGNQWFLNGTAITGAVNATHVVTSSGIYKVSAQVDDCVSAFSNDFEVTIPPTKPTAFAAADVKSSGFIASWTSVEGATSYLLDISADNFVTFLSNYNGKEVTGITEAVTNLKAATLFSYRVRAKNAGGTSANSNIVSATTLKQSQTITFQEIADKTLGDASFTFSATSSSGLAVIYNTSSSNITLNQNQVTLVGAGRASIQASQAGNEEFDEASNVTQSFCIRPAKPTVEVNSTVPSAPLLTSNATIGNQWYYNGAIIGGAVNSTYTATRSGIYKVNVKIDDCISEFSSDVTATLLLNAPVAAAASALTTTSFSASWSSEVGATSYLLDVSADNFLTFVNGYNGRELTTTSYTVTGLSAARAYSYRVRAKNTSLTSANSNVVNATTTKQVQTIAFAALSDRILGEAAFALTATASSNLSVTFSTTSPNITISTNQVALVKAGRTSIVANQAGNDVFNEAPMVTQSFCIKPLKPTVNITDVAPAAPVLTSNASAGNQWFLDGVAIEGATGTTHNAKKTGTYKVSVQVDDCVSAFSDDLAIVVVPIPVAPVAAAATEITTSSFLASWSTVEGATKYLLDVSTDNFASFVANYNAKEHTATSVVVEGVNAGSQYQYRVRAVNAGGISNNSSAITVLTAAITGDVKILEFTVSPNPIEDVFHVTGLKDGETNMQMIDMKGCAFPIFFERNADSLTASTAHLVSGVYLLRIFYRDELIQLKLLKK